MQMVVFSGVQGTGKTTFYGSRLARSHVRISLDVLRTRYREAILLEACLRAKQSLVVDNTNPTALERKRYVEPAAAAGFEIVGYYFRSRATDALAINERRPEQDRLPPKAVLGTLRRLELPRFAEGFDKLFYVRMDGHGDFIVEPLDHRSD